MKILLLFLSLAASATPAARAGWDNGNAGDTYTAEFILTARDVVERMKLLPTSELSGIDLNALAGAVLGTKVSSEERLELDGHEVDAINYPSQGKILLSRTRWRALRPAAETTNRLLLVLHEYLYVIGVDDSQFRHSARLVPQMGIKDFNPNRWWNPLNPVNRVTLGLEYQPAGCDIPSLDFRLDEAEEAVTAATTGDCGEGARTVQVTKRAFTAPPASGARGTFHRFEVAVRGPAGALLGGFTYEPEWGQCLLPQDGACRLSGRLSVGGVELNFWMLR